MENPSNPPRRRRTRKLLRRFTLSLGLAVAMSPTAAASRDRAASPRRASGTPPWLESSGFIPPPSSLDSSRARPAGSVHPAVHGNPGPVVSRLFPRASATDRSAASAERAGSITRHPAGKGSRNVLWSKSNQVTASGR